MRIARIVISYGVGIVHADFPASFYTVSASWTPSPRYHALSLDIYNDKAQEFPFYQVQSLCIIPKS